MSDNANDIVYAIDNNNYQSFLACLDAGVDIETRIPEHWNETILYHACQKLRIDMVQELLARGADPDMTDKDGEVCLYGTLRGFAENGEDPCSIIRMLINAGADVYKQTHDGKTVLSHLKAMEMPENYKASREEIFEQLTQPIATESEITFNRRIGRHDIDEIYRFDLQERFTYVRRRGHSDIEAVCRESFAAIGDTPALREAFKKHAELGGTVTPESVLGAAQTGFLPFRYKG